MAGAICNYSPKQQAKWADTMDNIYTYWKGKKRIYDRFYDQYNKFDEIAAADNMKWFIEQRLEVPFAADFVLGKDQIRRIYTEIDSFNNTLKGKLNNFAWIVPEGISKLDPTSRRFYLKLNDILNTERVNQNTMFTMNKEIADHMFKSYLNNESIGPIKGALTRKLGFSKDAITRITKLREQLAYGNPNELNQTKFVAEMEQFFNSNGGKEIKDLVTLVEMNNVDFTNLKSQKYYDPITKEPYNFNVHTYKAAESVKNLLNSSGRVYTNGLKEFEKVISWQLTGSNNVKNAMNTNRTAERMILNIRDAVDRINQGIKEGGYFPQLELGTLISLKDGMSKSLAAKTRDRERILEKTINSFMEEVTVKNLPDHVKGRNVNIKNYYDKDPLKVISEYANQAAGFNKMVYTQQAYFEALRNIPKTDLDFVKGVKRFIEEEYTVFIKNGATRPDWVNKAVAGISALQTVSTMGLNITGGIKNALSAVNYYAKVGYGAIGKTAYDMSHKTGKGEFAEYMTKAEKEAGFLFTDVSKELYSEGLISKSDYQAKEISFDPLTGSIKVEGKGIKDYMMDKGKGLAEWTIDKSLFVHRITENFQRKWMFRTAFHMKYNQLLDNGYSADKAYAFSKNFALEMVNGWAYEYAKHAKSKSVRGEWNTIDEIGDMKINRRLEYQAKGAGKGLLELGMQLMHYPQSLQESHWYQLKGAAKSLKSRQMPKEFGGTSEELSYLLKFGGFGLVTAAASVLFNTDLFNMFEVDDVNRIKHAIDSIHYPVKQAQEIRLANGANVVHVPSSKQSTFGLLGTIGGVGMNKLGTAIVAGHILDHNDVFTQVFFGNTDWANEEDPNTKRFGGYQYATFIGQWQNKIGPAMRSGRGRDVAMHYLKAYPSAWTKRWNDRLWGRTKNVPMSVDNQYYDSNVAMSLKMLGGYNKLPNNPKRKKNDAQRALDVLNSQFS